jgi:TP901 family phage tail tape measure protein
MAEREEVQIIATFVDNVSKNAKGVSGAINEIATGALRTLGETAVNAFGAAASAVANFGAGSLKVAGDFEGTMNSFASVTGDAVSAAGLELGDFRDLFLEMGAVTKYSAGEAAQAAVELAKGGLDPATIAAGGLEAALTLAAAGQLELATSAEITAKQLGVWGDTGVTAANVADLMAQAANASTVNVDDLAMGMANVGGVAKVAGASFQDTVQAMALLAPSFSSASDAGTSLKTFLSRLVPTSDTAMEAMRKLGLTTVKTFEDGSSIEESAFFNADGTFIGMAKAADLLQDSLSELGEAQKLEALGRIFGSDAIRAAAMLGEAGAEGFAKMGESMLAAGTAADQSAKLNQGWNFALESLMGSLETIQIVIGSALLPVITDFVNNAIIPAVNVFMEWAQVAMPAIIAGATAFGSTILGILSTIDFGPLMAAFAGLFDAAGVQMPTAGETISAVMAGITLAVQGVADFMNTVLIPALTTVVNWVAENWPAIQLTVDTVFSAIEEIISRITTNIQFYITAFSLALQGDWRGLGEFLRVEWDKAWEGIKQAVAAALLWFLDQDWAQIGSDIMAGIANGITAGAQWIMDAALAAVQAAVEVVKGFLGIESPSKLFRGMGENMGLGMAQGLDNTAGTVSGAAVGTAQAATMGVNNYYNLTIHSGGHTNVGAEFGRMRAIAGAF